MNVYKTLSMFTCSWKAVEVSVKRQNAGALCKMVLSWFVDVIQYFHKVVEEEVCHVIFSCFCIFVFREWLQLASRNSLCTARCVLFSLCANYSANNISLFFGRLRMEYKVHTTRGLGIVRLTHIATKKAILSSFFIRQEVVSSVNVEHWNAASAAPEKKKQQKRIEWTDRNQLMPCHWEKCCFAQSAVEVKLSIKKCVPTSLFTAS